MTKKLISLMLVIVLLACTASTAFAAEKKTASLMGDFGYSVDDFLSSPTNRAMGTWLCIIEFMVTFERDLDTIDLSKDTYVGQYGQRGGLDVFVPMAGKDGYYNLTWYPDKNEINLYEFPGWTVSKLMENNPTAVKNDTDEMINVGQVILEALQSSN